MSWEVLEPRFEVVRDRLRLHHRMVDHLVSGRRVGLLYRLRKGVAVSGGTFPRRALWQWVTYRRFSFVDLAMIVLLVQLLRGLWGLL